VCHAHIGILPVTCCCSTHGAAGSKSVSAQVEKSLRWVVIERKRHQGSVFKAAAGAMQIEVVAA